MPTVEWDSPFSLITFGGVATLNWFKPKEAYRIDDTGGSFFYVLGFL